MKNNDEIVIDFEYDISCQYTRGDILQAMRESLGEGQTLESAFGENAERAVQKIAERFLQRCDEYLDEIETAGPPPCLDDLAEYLWPSDPEEE